VAAAPSAAATSVPSPAPRIEIGRAATVKALDLSRLGGLREGEKEGEKRERTATDFKGVVPYLLAHRAALVSLSSVFFFRTRSQYRRGSNNMLPSCFVLN